MKARLVIQELEVLKNTKRDWNTMKVLWN